MRKTKWQIFTEKMSGLTTPEITRHIQKSRKEVREKFKVRDFKFEDKQLKRKSY